MFCQYDSVVYNQSSCLVGLHVLHSYSFVMHAENPAAQLDIYQQLYVVVNLLYGKPTAFLFCNVAHSFDWQLLGTILVAYITFIPVQISVLWVSTL